MPHDDRDARRWEAIEEATELLAEGGHEPALRLLRDAIRLDPHNPYAYHFAGVTLGEVGRLEAARDAFRAAVRLAPGYLAARLGLAHTLRRLGELDGALAQACQALERFPADGDAHFTVGMAHAARGERAAARRHLERCLACGPALEASIEARAVLAELVEPED
jgi:Flp pilus assembly protein TadD